MNVGYNYNQAILSGAQAPSAPYTPSYSVPMLSQPGGPAPMPQPMQIDNFESTRDKSVGDVIGGFFTGAGKAVYDMGHGLFFLGKVAGHAIEHPIDTLGSVGSAVVHGVSHPMQTAEMVITLPFKVANGIVKPYSQALQQGKYGEAMGRLAVDFTVIASSLSGGKKPPIDSPPPGGVVPPPPPAAGVVDDIGNVADDIGNIAKPAGGAGGAVNNTLHGNVGDTILEEIGKVGNVTGNGNTINVNIGNITVGGAQMNGNTINAAANAASSNLDDVGRAASNMAHGGSSFVDDAAKVVNNVDDIANAGAKASTTANAASQTASQTAGAYAAASGQSSTIGSKIGGGIDAVISAPGKAFEFVGNGFQSVGRGIQNIGNTILHPLETLRGFKPNPEAIANGIRSAGNALADGVIFASKNPGQALIIAGAVGRGGKAAEDILMELDLVR